MDLSFDPSRAVDYTAPLKPLKRNAALMPSMQVFSADFGPANCAYWVGRFDANTGRIATLAWPRFSLPGETATSRQAYLVERVLMDPQAAACSDYMLELQKPLNAVTKQAENIGAYGLQAALAGGLTAATRLRPASARRIYLRSPVHKFSVLGVQCPRKKVERKQLSRHMALNYLTQCEPANSLAWRVWYTNSDKQDDLADAMVGGMSALIEIDDRAPQPRLAHVKRALLAGLTEVAAPAATSAAAAHETVANKPASSVRRRVAFAPTVAKTCTQTTKQKKNKRPTRKQKVAPTL